jgi:CubicO group peptidase (beta-lactamase class C family)
MDNPVDTVTHLGNWRIAPYNRRAFSHVRELVPSANIATDPPQASKLPRKPVDLDAATLKLRGGKATSLKQFLESTFADGLMVLKGGRVAYEWHRNDDMAANPHIIFSVSKSVTALIAGILARQGKLDPDAPVTRYIPEAKSSAYADATVRHVLDMTVSLDFEENYLDPNGVFMRYRESTGWNPPRALSVPYLHDFIVTLKKAAREHGERFSYMSPNSDLLGWIVERAGGASFADLMRDLLWRPMGAAHDAYITLDPHGASRTAGGICMMLEDMARLGELARMNGAANGRQVVPASWMADIRNNGDAAAWQKGEMTELFPKGRYRSKWYAIGSASGAFTGIGIHGQWLYVDPAAEMVIAKQSSQPLPVDWDMDLVHADAFDSIAQHLRSS